MESEAKKAIEVVASEVIESAVPVVVKKLVSVISFGKPRKIKQRGTWERRTATKDRRALGVASRLRTGFWLEFHRPTGLGKFEIMDLSRTMRDVVYRAVVKHCQGYEFLDRTSGVVLEPSTIVESAIEVVWNDWISQPQEGRRAVLIIEGVADYLVSKYNVKQIDRRRANRRSSDPS